METTNEPVSRKSRIPSSVLRKLLPLAAIFGALFVMLTLCGWGFGNTNVKVVMDYHDRPVFFTAGSVPKKLRPSTLVERYQAGRWDGSELSAKGIKVAICDYGDLCYRLECQRTKYYDDSRYDSTWTVTVPVYPDIPVGQQSALIAEANAACADVTEFVQKFDDHRAKDPYGERTTRHVTKSTAVFGNNRIELYNHGRLLDARLFKSVGKVNLFSHKTEEDTWRTDFIVYADGERYCVYNDGERLITVIEGNVVFYDNQGQYFATYSNGVLRAYSDPHNIAGKALGGVTMAKMVNIPVVGQNRTLRYLAYMKYGQMYLADFISKIWKDGAPCGRRVPYKTLADLQAAINAGKVAYKDLRLEVAEDTEITDAAA